MISVATRPFDLVVEGTVQRVVDGPGLDAAAEAFATQGGPPVLPATPSPPNSVLPRRGAPPWNVYRLRPSSVFALGTAEPYGATRFDLELTSDR